MHTCKTSQNRLFVDRKDLEKSECFIENNDWNVDNGSMN